MAAVLYQVQLCPCPQPSTPCAYSIQTADCIFSQDVSVPELQAQRKVRGQRERKSHGNLAPCLELHHDLPQAYNPAEGWVCLLQKNWIAPEERATDTDMWASSGVWVSSSCVIKYQRMAGSNNGNLFSQSWRLEVWNQDAGTVGVFWSLSPQVLDGHLLPIPSHGLPSVGLCVLNSSPYLDTGQIGLGLILMTSFNLNSLFQSPISKHSHILRCWGLRFQQKNLGRDKVQPITSKETAAHLLGTIGCSTLQGTKNTQMFLATSSSVWKKKASPGLEEN